MYSVYFSGEVTGDRASSRRSSCLRSSNRSVRKSFQSQVNRSNAKKHGGFPRRNSKNDGCWSDKSLIIQHEHVPVRASPPGRRMIFSHGLCSVPNNNSCGLLANLVHAFVLISEHTSSSMEYEYALSRDSNLTLQCAKAKPQRWLRGIGAPAVAKPR